MNRSGGEGCYLKADLAFTYLSVMKSKTPGSASYS